MRALIDRIACTRAPAKDELIWLLEHHDAATDEYLFALAERTRRRYYGRDIYVRGLIEFTNYCKNDCLYCGIRCGNTRAARYRLTQEDILACCAQGHALGFRTFVLQGGEDPYFTSERIAALVCAIKAAHPDCAVTLSVGEHSRRTYQRWFDAGADRYLLRHETANDAHYRTLHPPAMRPENRRRCLYDLKEIGYQVGCGFMAGSPGQTAAHLAEDLLFIRAFEPDMVGVGPFIPHSDTPFGRYPAGTLQQTLFLLGLIRLLLPSVLLPATTALGTIDPQGREKGVLAGANVCMPNLTPPAVRGKYALYDNKLCTGSEAADGCAALAARMAAIGCRVVVHRGDRKPL